MERNYGNLVTRQDEIMDEVVKFYECLYSVKESIKDESDSDMITTLPIKQLTDLVSKQLAGEILIQELSESLKNMKNGKSPEPDELAVDFYECFLPDLSYFL